jgi:hypothetical protein
LPKFFSVVKDPPPPAFPDHFHNPVQLCSLVISAVLTAQYVYYVTVHGLSCVDTDSNVRLDLRTLT